MKRRPKGTGSVGRMPDGRWYGRYTGFDRRRHSVYAASPELVEVKLAATIAALPKAQARPRPADARGYTAPARRYVIGIVLSEARAQGWDDVMLAQVLTAQLAGSRMAAGIVGPCAYCGTWVAAEVEHRTPRTRGGTDDPANLVSACRPCNVEKNDMTAKEYVDQRDLLRYVEATGKLPAGYTPPTG